MKIATTKKTLFNKYIYYIRIYKKEPRLLLNKSTMIVSIFCSSTMKKKHIHDT